MQRKVRLTFGGDGQPITEDLGAWLILRGNQHDYDDGRDVGTDPQFALAPDQLNRSVRYEWMPLPEAPGSAAPSPDTGKGKRIVGTIGHVSNGRSELSAQIIAALSKAPVSVGDGEAVAWRYRDHPENGWVYTGVGGRHDGCEVQPLYTHPSDTDATERMRAALKHYACSCEPGHCAMSDDGGPDPVDDQLCGRVAQAALGEA